jgi:hypothetical protein
MYNNTCDRIYLTAIGKPPCGSSKVHVYIQKIQGTTQNKQYMEQHINNRTTQKIHRTTQKLG